MIYIKEVINFIKTARILINKSQYRFEPRTDKGQDYVQTLLQDFGIIPDEAIKIILYLRPHMYQVDKMPLYYQTGCMVFKREVEGVMAYIKLKVELGTNGEELVIISFHKDR